MLTGLPGGAWGFLLFVNLFIFFIAFFLDFFEIVFIIVPLLAPIAKVLLTPIVGEDAALIWFGVMLCVNLQTSFMHPPFGFALFYLRGVAPKEVKSSDIYWGAIPWVILQLILVALVVAFPKQVTMFLCRSSTTPEHPDRRSALAARRKPRQNLKTRSRRGEDWRSASGLAESARWRRGKAGKSLEDAFKK
jgi:hypothetical protein